MFNGLDIKSEHRDAVIDISDIDILSLSNITDKHYIRAIDTTKFCESKFKTIEFYGVRDNSNNLIYCPMFSSELITYDEFKGSVMNLIISNIIKGIDNISISNKSLEFINLSNGAVVGIGSKLFIKDYNSKFYYGDNYCSLLGLLRAFNRYIDYINNIKDSCLEKQIKELFNYVYDSIDNICSGIIIDWCDTISDKGNLEWTLIIRISGFVRRFIFSIKQFGDGLKGRVGNGEYKGAYESVYELVEVLKNYIAERDKIVKAFPDKFNYILDLVRYYIGDENIKDVKINCDAKNIDYSCLLVLSEYKVNVYFNGGFRVYIDFIVGDNVITESVARNLSNDKIKRYTSLMIKLALNRVEELIFG